jgi:hypothetical protein
MRSTTYNHSMASSPFVINPSINAKLPYDTFKAFTPVALVARSFDIVVVNPKLPFMSIQDVIAYAKANPGTVGGLFQSPPRGRALANHRPATALPQGARKPPVGLGSIDVVSVVILVGAPVRIFDVNQARKWHRRGAGNRIPK